MTQALTIVPAFSMSDIEKVAGAIAKGGLFGSKDPYAVLTLCLLAQAEGQHPAVVFRDYHIISGKPAKKADAMLRDFLVGGGKVEWHSLTDSLADATFSHPSGGSARITWDEARVKQAQLGGNAMHKKYPRQMLRARVVSEGVRTVFPGATSGLYVPEEAATFDEAPQPTVQGEQPPMEQFEGGTKGARQRVKLDGPYTSKTALWNAYRVLDREVRGCGDIDELDVLLGLEETKALIAQCERDAPQLLDGGDGLPEEFMPLHRLVEAYRTELTANIQQGERLVDQLRAG